ncbi:zinc ribbon domain-containing protein YjdM [Clostridiaceae bacterium HSG29]|nr:zinc ribbon domain-containing protein YjdM [Clostridiaceae bacterium HSG29]
MAGIPNCPKCDSEYTYEDGNLIVCPMCGYEWSNEMETEEERVVRDSNGTILHDGDSVTVIKDLKVKGSSSDLKRGTKVKSIRLVEDADGGHDIDCKIDGFGGMYLKSEYVKKI